MALWERLARVFGRGARERSEAERVLLEADFGVEAMEEILDRVSGGGDGDFDFRSLFAAELFADVKHRSFISLAFADNDFAVDIYLIQRRAHRIARSLVRAVAVAFADPHAARERSRFGDANEFEC